jgi:hypothetical protein
MWNLFVWGVIQYTRPLLQHSTNSQRRCTVFSIESWYLTRANAYLHFLNIFFIFIYLFSITYLSIDFNSIDCVFRSILVPQQAQNNILWTQGSFVTLPLLTSSHLFSLLAPSHLINRGSAVHRDCNTAHLFHFTSILPSTNHTRAWLWVRFVLLCWKKKQAMCNDTQRRICVVMVLYSS